MHFGFGRGLRLRALPAPVLIVQPRLPCMFALLFGSMTECSVLDNNKLTGMIPTEVWWLTSLTSL